MRFSSVLTLSLIASPAFAWGPAGHVIVARIAELNLSDDAKAAVADLLPDPNVSDSQAVSNSSLANFADHVRRNPAYPQFTDLNKAHYVDIPVDPQFQGDPLTFCQDGKCVITAIENFKLVLADKNLPKQRRQEALAFLVHFVGDLHQPLHCATRNDTGGNDLKVKLLGMSGHHHMVLHSVWDGDILHLVMPSPSALNSATTWNTGITAAEKTAWRTGTTKDWVMESYTIARDVSYRKADGSWLPTTGTPNLDQAYVDKAKPAVEKQIKRAGIRLAKTLNDALAP